VLKLDIISAMALVIYNFSVYRILI